MGKITVTDYDSADYIETKEDVLAFLDGALKENDPELISPCSPCLREKSSDASFLLENYPENYFFHMVVRGTRLSENKQMFTIYDYTDTILT